MSGDIQWQRMKQSLVSWQILIVLSGRGHFGISFPATSIPVLELSAVEQWERIIADMTTLPVSWQILSIWGFECRVTNCSDSGGGTGEIEGHLFWNWKPLTLKLGVCVIDESGRLGQYRIPQVDIWEVSIPLGAAVPSPVCITTIYSAQIESLCPRLAAFWSFPLFCRLWSHLCSL